MKRFATVFVALGLATAGSTALAQQRMDPANKQATPQPVQMTDAQLDTVAGGAFVQTGLINVDVGGVFIPVRVLNNSVNGNQIQLPVAVGIGAGVLGNGVGSGIAGAFGRQH